MNKQLCLLLFLVVSNLFPIDGVCYNSSCVLRLLVYEDHDLLILSSDCI